MCTNQRTNNGIHPNPEDILHPFLDEALRLTCPGSSPDPLFKVFYSLPNPSNTTPISSGNNSILIPEPLSPSFVTRGDSALDHASLLFQKLTGTLSKVAEVHSMWPEVDIHTVDDD